MGTKHLARRLWDLKVAIIVSQDEMATMQEEVDEIERVMESEGKDHSDSALFEEVTV